MPFSSEKFKVETLDGENFSLLEDVSYVAQNGNVYTIKKGAESDGASAPSFIWNIIPPFGNYWREAYLHDYLYRYTTLAKSVCDNLFYEAMIGNGVSKVKAWELYEAVKLAGGTSFSNDRKQQTTFNLS